MGRVCVYTAISGDYDTLKSIPEQDVACDYFCFSDNPGLTNLGRWKMLPLIGGEKRHPRMRARPYKVLHHRLKFVRRYDHSVWIDGSIQVKSSSFVREFLQRIGASGWSMFVHPDRHNILTEAEFSPTMPKYFDQPIKEQIAAYQSENYPMDGELIATGLIARSTAVDLSAIEEMWWSEQLRWSYQDQLSLPVVLWRLRRSCDLVRDNLWSNEWFEWIPHLRED